MMMKRNFFLTAMGFAAALIQGQTHAAIPDAITMVRQLSQSIDSIMVLILVLAYVIGIHQIISGLHKFKKMGQEGGGGRAGLDHLSGPIAHLIIGGIFMYLPTALNVGVSSFFGSKGGDFLFTSTQFVEINRGCNAESLLTGSAASCKNQSSLWGYTANATFKIIQAIGLISFIRGWLLLLQHADKSGSSNDSGGFSKGLTHVIAGILAMNFVTLLQVVGKTLGFAIP